jgi:hypothetical protein
MMMFDHPIAVAAPYAPTPGQWYHLALNRG